MFFNRPAEENLGRLIRAAKTITLLYLASLVPTAVGTCSKATDARIEAGLNHYTPEESAAWLKYADSQGTLGRSFIPLFGSCDLVGSVERPEKRRPYNQE